MKISVEVKTNARENSVIELEPGRYAVRTTELPINGRANLAVIELLAEHLNRPKSDLAILKGLSSKRKILELED